MSTIKISQLPNFTTINSNTANTLFVGVDVPTQTTYNFTAHTLSQGLFANEVLNVGINPNTLPNTVAQFAATGNVYIQTNLINTNSNGSADHVITANYSSGGSDTTYFIDMGFANGGFVPGSEYNSLGTAINPLDGYLYVQGKNGSRIGGNLTIGTATSGTEVRVTVGGGSAANVAAKYTSAGLNLINSSVITFNDNTTQSTAALPLTGGTVTGPIVINGSSIFNGTVVNNGVRVNNGSTTFNGSLTANGSVTTAGTLTIGGTIIPSTGTISLGTVAAPFNNIYTSNSTILFANSNVNIVGTLTANGTTTFNGNVTTNGTLTTVGALNVNNTTSLVGTTTATGNVITNGTLTVNGNTITNGTSNLIGYVTVTGNLTANGTTIFNGNVTHIGPWTANGSVSINGAVSANVITANVVTANAVSSTLSTVGTWTPSMIFATTQGTQVYSTQVGNYCKTGRKVYATFNIVITSLGGGVGNFSMSLAGLPTPMTGTGIFGGLFINGQTATTIDPVGMNGSVASGATAVPVFGQIIVFGGGGSVTYRQITAADLGGTTNITGVVDYISAT